MTPSPREQIAAALRSPFVPDVAADLARCEGVLEAVWPQLAPSVDTAGFLGSALYMADMALEAVYEPELSPQSLLGGALTDGDLERLLGVLDVFHWVQPQLLLLCAALAEAQDAPAVGGQGRLAPRETSERERAHLTTEVELASPGAGPLPEVAKLLQLPAPPELYRAVAVWPGYLEAAWEELQHLVAYPLFRQRGRGLYYYGRSSSRFLAQPLRANPESTDGLGCAGCRARNGRFGGCGSGWWRWQGATVAVRACGQEETAVGRRSQACWRQAVERSARPSGVRSGAGSPAAGRGRR